MRLLTISALLIVISGCTPYDQHPCEVELYDSIERQGETINFWNCD